MKNRLAAGNCEFTFRELLVKPSRKISRRHIPKVKIVAAMLERPCVFRRDFHHQSNIGDREGVPEIRVVLDNRPDLPSPSTPRRAIISENSSIMSATGRDSGRVGARLLRESSVSASTSICRYLPAERSMPMLTEISPPAENPKVGSRWEKNHRLSECRPRRPRKLEPPRQQ